MDFEKTNGQLTIDERTFMEQVFQTYKRLMFSIVRKYSIQIDDQEDIVQNALLRLCKNVRTLQGLSEHALVVYIAQTVRNLSLNHLEHQQVLEKHCMLINAERTREPGVLDHYFEEEAQQEEYRRFRLIWDKLSEEERTLLYERYVFQCSYAELAKRYQCTEEAMRMRIHRLRKRSIRAAKGLQEVGI